MTFLGLLDLSLLDLLEVGVLDVVALLTALLAALGTTVESGSALCTIEGVTLGACTCLLSSSVHLLGSIVQLVGGSVDGSEVLSLVGIAELLEGSLDFGLHVGRQLVAALLEHVLGLEDHRVGLVELVDLLALTLVGVCIGFCLSLHALNLFLREAAGSFDADGLLLTGGLILGADLQDTVGIDIEADLNLRHATTGGSDAGEVELTDALVLRSHGAFALKDVDGHLGLVVGSGGEDFALLARNGRIHQD